jgi:recombination protein RecA
MVLAALIARGRQIASGLAGRQGRHGVNSVVETRVKVVKNKVAPPFKQVQFDIIYGEGVSKTGELIELGVKGGIVEKSGSWYAYGSQKIGQGKEAARRFLRENPAVAIEIEDKIRAKSATVADAMYSPPSDDEAKDAEEG